MAYKGLQRELYYGSQIDYCYWSLRQIAKYTGPKSVIEAMVDDVTGFSKEKFASEKKNVIMLVKTIIRCKKKLNYETETEQKFLEQIMSIGASAGNGA